MINDSFLKRFRSVWAQQQRMRWGRALVTTLLVAVLGLMLIALADLRWELTREARQFALALVATGSLLVGVRQCWSMVRTAAPRNTAAQIEATFPELGQSVRTAVQYGRLQPAVVQQSGVATSLVAALLEDTHRRALPLTIEEVVPAEKFWLTTIGLLAAVLFWAAACSQLWDVSRATQRVFGSEAPYRVLVAGPGDLTVDEGRGLELYGALAGWADRPLVLQTRPAGSDDTAWSERELLPFTADAAPATATAAGPATGPATDAVLSPPEAIALLERGLLTGNAPSRDRAYGKFKLSRLTRPLEYRVIAGSLETPVYRVAIRSPLKLEAVEATLTPPAYTGLAPSVANDGNLAALQGTTADVLFRFDKGVADASMILAPRVVSPAMVARTENAPGEIVEPVPPEQPQTLPLLVMTDPHRPSADSTSSAPAAPTEPTVATISLELTESQTYTLVAQALDGTRLPERKFRIRVWEDQPPQIQFEAPEDSLEVHALAEVPIRVRVRDDYGLMRAGVIFQINNEQEVPLIAEEFDVLVEAAEEAAAAGTISPTTQRLLEQMLPLEFFELTQKDSVMYYAYAEDTRPGEPQRTETDLRFLDIRPFRRQYQVFDPDPMPGGGGGNGPVIRSLEELITRQRFSVNRTMVIEKRAAVGRNPDPQSLEQLISFETELAANVRDTALGLEARGFDDTELFYQSEAAMLQAVDSLSVGNWSSATAQMKDALKLLIEQRDRTAVAINKNPDRQRLAELRAFDRRQLQKLRRPKSDKEEARDLVRRLEALIRQEQAVAGTLDPKLVENTSATTTEGSAASPEATASEGAAPSDSATPPATDDANSTNPAESATATEPNAPQETP